MSMTNKCGRIRLGLALLVAVSVPFLTFDSVTAKGVTAPTEAKEISATDAKILLYVSPVGERVRAAGLDIAMERQTSVKLNQSDYYFSGFTTPSGTRTVL